MAATRRRGAASTSMRAPDPNRRRRRAIFALLLCLVAPPLGLALLWRVGIFRMRGRVLVTVLATLEMALFVALILPTAELDTVFPTPGSSARATPAPESDVKNALYNMEQILYQQQLDEVLAQGGSELDLLDPAAQLDQAIQEQDAIMNTTVYAFNGNGAIYYHTNPVCGNQANRRSLTVAEAVEEGLSACPDCNPPSYGFNEGVLAPNENPEDG